MRRAKSKDIKAFMKLSIIFIYMLGFLGVETQRLYAKESFSKLTNDIDLSSISISCNISEASDEFKNIHGNIISSIESKKCKSLMITTVNILRTIPYSLFHKANINKITILQAESLSHDAYNYWYPESRESYVLISKKNLWDSGIEFTLAHEIFHSIHVAISPNTPQWLREAMAIYFESLIYSPAYSDRIFIHRSLNEINNSFLIYPFDDNGVHTGNLESYGSAFAYFAYTLKVKNNIDFFSNIFVSHTQKKIIQQSFWPTLLFNPKNKIKAAEEFYQFMKITNDVDFQKSFLNHLKNFYKTIIFNRPSSDTDDLTQSLSSNKFYLGYNFPTINFLKAKKKHNENSIPMYAATISVFQQKTNSPKIKKSKRNKKVTSNKDLVFYIRKHDYPYYIVDSLDSTEFEEWKKFASYPDFVINIKKD